MNIKTHILFFAYTFLYLLSGCAPSDVTSTYDNKRLGTLIQPPPIINPQAFSHNDYLHQRPLIDALVHGFVNIEADVFLFNGKLVVTHYFPFFKGDATIERLYLDPLYHLFLNKSIPRNPLGNKPLILMVDIKSFSESTYIAIQKSLYPYRKMLTSYDSGIITERAVTVVISGNKPHQLMAKKSHRLAFIDHDLEDIEECRLDSTVSLMASAKYSHVISWQGEGAMTAEEEKRIRRLIQKAHNMGFKVRLWASPEREIVWSKLLSCGVDMISTDSLFRLQKYLIRYNKNSRITSPAELTLKSLSF